MSLPEQTSDIVHKAATTATYGGGGGAVYFGLTSNEWAAWVGVAIALAGYLTNLYYRHQHLKLTRAAMRLGEGG